MPEASSWLNLKKKSILFLQKEKKGLSDGLKIEEHWGYKYPEVIALDRNRIWLSEKRCCSAASRSSGPILNYCSAPLFFFVVVIYTDLPIRISKGNSLSFTGNPSVYLACDREVFIFLYVLLRRQNMQALEENQVGQRYEKSLFCLSANMNPPNLTFPSSVVSIFL